MKQAITGSIRIKGVKMIHLETKSGKYMIYRLWIDSECKSFRQDWQTIFGTDIPEAAINAKMFAITDEKRNRVHFIGFDDISGFVNILIEGVI